ncbi:hypothetical protein LHV13_03095 [Ferrovum sp. PN-J185]|uniref:hypothetical protein n=1 Tax=Ferrovum sp. PN-J185 TaxID=1356306 RepID=UPI0007929D1D|nr:hypothetical protein [Ferrovum sp. PN-J185]KXW56490.1 hypothetical protein FV185_04390 [Ferrovum sp. PN-J185]MCC6068161.1 hypothetical protein [Ferrovum sp. PN-J185]MDE1891726.1 hypothetical protein [Betaproteobacteria bacterium]MDE2056432.1 hypothetical protein [Betaproteobacteria bacterium]
MFNLNCLLKRSPLLAICLCFASTLFLSSCGGGAAAAIAGVGSGGTGVSSGTIVQGLVTGFGSIFIDGTEYPLSTSAQIKEVFDGSSSSSGLLSLGQVVTATVDSSNTVVSAEISPDLQGVITYQPTAFTTTVNGTCAASTDYYLYVLNQPVRIVTQACNTPLGVTTVFNEPFVKCSLSTSTSYPCTNGTPNGYISSLIAGAEVKVHGFWVLNPSTSKPELVATRIDEYYVPSNASIYYSNPIGVNQAASNYELSGIVTNISGSTVAINGGNGVNGGNANSQSYGGSNISSLATPSNLAVNQVVSMYVTSANWSNYFATNQWNTSYTPTTVLPVSNLVINSATSNASTSNPTVQVSGIITSISGSIAIINGTSVLLPTSCTNCAVGDYVKIKGSNNQGEVDGSSIELSLASNEINTTSSVNLKGIILFPTAATNGTTTIVFQGVSVNVPQGVLLSGCNVGSTQYVQVNASYQNGQLSGNSVTCSSLSTAVTNSNLADYVGTSSNFSTTSNQFNFVTNNANYVVTYSSTTYLGSDLVTGSNNIEVIGVITSLPSGNNPGYITATSLKKTDSSTTLKTESD